MPINGINQYKITNASGISRGVSNDILFSIKVISVDGKTEEQIVEEGMEKLAVVFNEYKKPINPNNKLNFLRVR